MRRRAFCALAGFALFAPPPVGRAMDNGADAGASASPTDLWRGYDPEALPLDVQVVRSWQEDGGSYEKLYFTGEVAGGGRVRVFAIQGAPANGRSLPGILHIHGGGQTASLGWVQYWVKRGYVCVSFDFCGAWEKRTEFTDWGPIPHANMAQANGGFQVRPTPRESSWYHWAVTARRSLTLLSRHLGVDARRLGVFGVSVGGNLTWMVAGSDARVKAAVPIYGSGYNQDNRRQRWGFGALTEDQALFQRTLSPEAHAPYVTRPVLHLNATNDHHAWMDAGYETLSAARAPVRQALTPRYIHHIAPEQGANLERWMDWHLRGGKAFPESPRIQMGLNAEGIPLATLQVKDAGGARKVDVYYTLGDKLPQARFWRRAEAVRRGDRWEAILPVMDVWQEVFAFANVTYASRVCISSNLAHVLPGQLGKTRATLRWSPALEHGRDGFENWYFTVAYTDPDNDTTHLRTGSDAEKGPYLTLNPEIFGDPMHLDISSHIIGDPQHAGREGMALSFLSKGGFGEAGLKVSVVENDWGPRSRTYTATLKKEELTPGWVRVVLPLSRFTSAEGKSPARWQDLDKLQLQGSVSKREPPAFTRFRWVAGATEGT